MTKKDENIKATPTILITGCSSSISKEIINELRDKYKIELMDEKIMNYVSIEQKKETDIFYNKIGMRRGKGKAKKNWLKGMPYNLYKV